MTPSLGVLATLDAQRILDRAARRLLAARLDGDPVGTPAGADDGPLDDGPDQGSPLVKVSTSQSPALTVIAGAEAASSSSWRSRA